MSQQELQAIHAALEQAAMNPPSSLEQGRAGFDHLMSTFPVPADVLVEEQALGGRSVTVCTPKQRTGSRTLLYFHGGGFSAGSPAGFRGMVGDLAKRSAAQAVIPAYRLAPEHAFPAAADDALAQYRALLERGVAPSQIVVAGDSAGANLALGALVAARDAGLPLPAGAVLLSPWVDLDLEGESIKSKASRERFISAGLLAHSAAMYLAQQPAGDLRASPLRADLSGLPAMCIQVGTAEILLDDALRLARKASHADVAVELHVWPHMLHVWQAFAPALSEGRDALQEVADFMDRAFRKLNP